MTITRLVDFSLGGIVALVLVISLLIEMRTERVVQTIDDISSQHNLASQTVSEISHLLDEALMRGANVADKVFKGNSKNVGERG